MTSSSEALSLAIKAAAAAAKKNDASATVAALEAALSLARAQAPLAVRVAVPINHDHVGLGLYTPAPNDAVEGRRVRLYVEVANHMLTTVGEGRFRAQIDVRGAFSYDDMSAGKLEVIQLQEVSLGSQSYETRSAMAVTSFGVELKLGDKSPAGTWHVKLTLTDAVGGKSASKDVRFVLS